MEKHVYTLVGTKCLCNYGGIAFYTRDDESDDVLFARYELGTDENAMEQCRVEDDAVDFKGQKIPLDEIMRSDSHAQVTA